MKKTSIILFLLFQIALGIDISNITKHCNKGNMTACSMLGDMYYVADNVPQDYAKAQKFGVKHVMQEK